VKPGYVPDAGDLVWASFDPQSGHEQAGRRPALVLSPRVYNEKVGLALACPITSKVKGYPFEVEVDSTRVRGVVLADQIRSFDWRSRQFTFIAQAAPETLDAVVHILQTLLAVIEDQ
jgi:mRNA interferase MazF